MSLLELRNAIPIVPRKLTCRVTQKTSFPRQKTGHLSAKQRHTRKNSDPQFPKRAVAKAKRVRTNTRQAWDAEKDIVSMCFSSLEQLHEKGDALVRRLADFGYNNIQGGAGNNRPARNLLLDILADIDRNKIEITTWMGVMEKTLSSVRS
ncbi:hypothetical protein CC2G_013346 [Coprinopsis cinerea AmutBmut pab1-1]|nr:hypothetical protein CC2G_013346 [Coprinopsis cinerea AmutBmut pab1-1]